VTDGIRLFSHKEIRTRLQLSQAGCAAALGVAVETFRTWDAAVTNAGTIRFKTRLLYLSTALKAHRVGLEEVDDGIWSLYFCDVLLGRIDERTALVKGQLGVTHVPG
jgi:hypothetical protein